MFILFVLIFLRHRDFLGLLDCCFRTKVRALSSASLSWKGLQVRDMSACTVYDGYLRFPVSRSILASTVELGSL